MRVKTQKGLFPLVLFLCRETRVFTFVGTLPGCRSGTGMIAGVCALPMHQAVAEDHGQRAGSRNSGVTERRVRDNGRLAGGGPGALRAQRLQPLHRQCLGECPGRRMLLRVPRAGSRACCFACASALLYQVMAAYEAIRHRENNHGIIVTSAVVLQTRQCRRCGEELAAVQDCSAAGMSDAAEEVAWPALRVVAPQPSCAAARARAGGDADGGPLSPAVAAVGSETAAAVNLLSMSVRDSDLPGAPADCGGRQGPGARAWAGPRAAQPARPAPEGAAAAGAAAAAGPDARTYAPTDARAAGRSPAAERCMRGSPAAEAAGRAPAAPACSDRYGWGPLPLAADEEERRLGDPGAAAAAEAEGAALREARDGAAREAAAADAAVAAVAKARAPRAALCVVHHAKSGDTIRLVQHWPAVAPRKRAPFARSLPGV